MRFSKYYGFVKAECFTVYRRSLLDMYVSILKLMAFTNGKIFYNGLLHKVGIKAHHLHREIFSSSRSN